MKTGQIARMLGVTAKTIISWVEMPDLNKFFSSTATRSESAATQRAFTREDLYILNTIRLKKTRTNSWSDVAKLIEAGELELELPPSAMLVESASPLENMQLVLQVQRDLEIALARLEDRENQLTAEQEKNERLNQELAKIKAEKAVLEYQLKEALKAKPQGE